MHTIKCSPRWKILYFPIVSQKQNWWENMEDEADDSYLISGSNFSGSSGSPANNEPMKSTASQTLTEHRSFGNDLTAASPSSHTNFFLKNKLTHMKTVLQSKDSVKCEFTKKRQTLSYSWNLQRPITPCWWREAGRGKVSRREKEEAAI